jgi:hypothetical protein
MKIVELLNSIRIPITNEEESILSRFDEGEIVLKSDLEPREQLMANSLVNKDILTRKTVDGKIQYYKKIR